MIIECPYCMSRVTAVKHGGRKHYDPREDPFPYEVQVLACPSCNNTLVGLEEEYPEEYQDGRPRLATRLWPNPKQNISWHLPEIVKTSLEEADRCISSGAFSACVVMSGRALEGIGVYYKMKSKSLQGILKELKEHDIIDSRLYEWSNELRIIRNIGAHATTDKVVKQDAEDVLEFTKAICDYVFILTNKFEEFKKRRNQESKLKST
jgi:hypothetical protein